MPIRDDNDFELRRESYGDMTFLGLARKEGLPANLVAVFSKLSSATRGASIALDFQDLQALQPGSPAEWRRSNALRDIFGVASEQTRGELTKGYGALSEAHRIIGRSRILAAFLYPTPSRLERIAGKKFH